MTVFPHFIVMQSGITTIDGVLEDFAIDPEVLASEFSLMSSKSHALAFARSVFMEVNDRLSQAPAPEESKKMVGQMIIATHKDIYVCDPYHFVYEPKAFVCMGSGSSYALGYLTGVKLTPANHRERIVQALRVSIALDSSCGAPIHLHEVVKEGKEVRLR